MKQVHLIGIGGSGLSAIATVLLESGIEVSGSDRQASPHSQRVQAAGGRVFIGHSAANIQGADLVVRSSAIPDDNPEVLAAQQAGIPVLKRQDFLRQLTAGKYTIAVAGTHGKTTTTAMIAWLLVRQGFDPSFIIGGVAANLRTNAHAGHGPHFVVEADEYDYMFLGLAPQIAVVTNIEHDHPDCYPTRQDFYQAFQEFTSHLAVDGVLIACGDDPGAAQLIEERSASYRTITFGLLHSDVDYRAENLQPDSEGGIVFHAICRSSNAGQSSSASQGIMSAVQVNLQVPGEHNVRNALAALAVADELGIQLASAASALAEYTGTGRRFELLGQASGVTIIDDYAHHPTEIQATLAAARARYPDRSIWAVWQPHTYSRTRLLSADFTAAFGDPASKLVEHVIVTEIYAAREAPPADGYSASQLVQAMPHPDVHFIPDLPQVQEFLLPRLSTGDVLLVLSAGDANQLSTQVLHSLRNNELEPVRAAFGDRLQRNVPLARYTAARVGGPADGLMEIDSAEELGQVVTLLWKHKIPFFLLGSGSNVLVSDAGIRGVTLVNQARQVHFSKDATPPTVWAESGANFGALARKAVQYGLSGLEWAAGIPGTVGGAVVGNAGAHGSDMSANLLLAEILHHPGQAEVWPVQKMGYKYRSSVLKGRPTRQEMGGRLPSSPQAVVLSATLRLEPSTPQSVKEKMDAFGVHRRRTQPPGASMGSMFKNPAGDYAGRLIEAAGLKGARRGAAVISPVHANFFINQGHATAADIIALIDLARGAVREKFGVELELEIELAGDWTSSGI
jgi:UDP-N-acetylmuramate--alanine ligase